MVQHPGVRAGTALVVGDHQTTRVRHRLAHLGQPGVSSPQHGRDPGAVRVEGGPQRLGDHVLGHRFTEPGGHLVAGVRPPVHVPRVGHEEHRADDPVGQRLGIAVVVVRARTHRALAVRFVRDERDRVRIGAERGAGQRQPPLRRLAGLADRLTPAQGVTGVVDLVEDHQGVVVFDPDP
ncbi:hypothetical protein SDC9_182424 [bioreactor metagenome]|uniref:Uncharacterized protein n=1 Tax=bioreactor metagenome TaxID=1076179 RepID=A0A645H8B3_9ZZZZ